MSSVKDTLTPTCERGSLALGTMPLKRSHDTPDHDDDHFKLKKLKPTQNEGSLQTKEPPKKISFGLSNKFTAASGGGMLGNKKISFGSIKMAAPKSLVGESTVDLAGGTNTVKPTGKVKVAAAFEDDEDEEEEMPPEAKMRMKNIGRNTPTSAGPNSFGKGRMGFCDSKKMFEKTMKEKEEKFVQK